MTSNTPGIVTISYHDLIQFRRNDNDALEENNIVGNDDSAPLDKNESRILLMEDIGRAYGSEGLGILCVKDVPGFADLRQQLLPLAAKIPCLPQDDLSRIVVEEAYYAVGWSHGKEELQPGVPDLSKGSFYANPLVNDLCQAMLERRKKQKESDISRVCANYDDKIFEENLKRLAENNPSFFAPNVFPQTLPDLEGAIFDMGQCIATVGRLVARVCQSYCERQGVHVELEKILSESLNCKARLLHYFETSNYDQTNSSNPPNNADEKKDEPQPQPEKVDEWWCGWHNDHGSLTGLVPAIYLTDNGERQLTSSPDPNAGLYIQSRSGEMVKVNLRVDCLGFQIGETFQILSGGLLQATPHAVKQTAIPGVTRESFAVFLEPEYEFPMAIPTGRTVDHCCPDNKVNESLKLNSIKSRWVAGMTFGEFNDVTLQAFY